MNVFAFDRDAGRDMLSGIDGDIPDGRIPIVSEDGDDTVSGTDAGEPFTLRDRQVMTTSGGADIVNLVAGGTIRVTDSDRGTDLLFLDDFGACLIYAISTEADETGTTIVHGDATVILDGVFLTGWRSDMLPTSRLDRSALVGTSLLGARAMPTYRNLTARAGNSILTIDLEHLRYCAPRDGTGDDVAFAYTVTDSWAIAAPLDTRTADRYGVAAGSVGFDPVAINDASRGLDGAHTVAHDAPSRRRARI